MSQQVEKVCCNTWCGTCYMVRAQEFAHSSKWGRLIQWLWEFYVIFCKEMEKWFAVAVDICYHQTKNYKNTLKRFKSQSQFKSAYQMATDISMNFKRITIDAMVNCELWIAQCTVHTCYTDVEIQNISVFRSKEYYRKEKSQFDYEYNRYVVAVSMPFFFSPKIFHPAIVPLVDTTASFGPRTWNQYWLLAAGVMCYVENSFHQYLYVNKRTWTWIRTRISFLFWLGMWNIALYEHCICRMQMETDFSFYFELLAYNELQETSKETKL